MSFLGYSMSKIIVTLKAGLWVIEDDLKRHRSIQHLFNCPQQPLACLLTIPR